jgi:DNA-binding MltR family transcriptional regulator
MDRKAREEQILQELGTESDRGCILVAASALNVFLEEMLKAALIAEPHAVKHAIDPLFEQMGPIATFSAKIKLAYGLGLINKSDFTDLEKIRRIRNIVSHEHSTMTFESREIIEISRTLEGADLAVPHLPVPEKKGETRHPASTTKPQEKSSKERMRFTITVAWIAGSLDSKSKYFESDPRARRDMIKLMRSLTLPRRT